MFTLCATTLASIILQVSLGTGHYLCRGARSGEGKHRRGVKAISDCLEGGGLNVLMKKFWGGLFAYKTAKFYTK